jgi:hypothetical protein
MLRVLPVLLVVPLLLAYGVAEGLWTDRWQLSPELEQAPRRLAHLPHSLGPWQGTDDELGPRQARQAELRGHLLRRYVHPEGETLTVLVVCGRPGPIAVHSPHVCYGGAGYTPARRRARHLVEAEGLSAEFWAERYKKAGAAVPEPLQIYYSWNAGDGWVAAESPRPRFARARALYKLYVVRRLPRPDEPDEHDPIPGFLRLLVPPLEHCLFAAP